jgi:hypothetical protein
MTRTPLERWHELVRTQNASGIGELLADDVIFYSPVVHTPQVGKPITSMYLSAAFQVLFNPSFRYVREVVGPRDAVLEFQVEIGAVSVTAWI